MDTAQWPQGIGVVKCGFENSNPNPTPKTVDKKPRPQKEQALNCPRCNSTNTKFCYYNNYSLSQPRYFCKTCRRYWTEGGSLRNVPVGGGSRKNKRSSSSFTAAPPQKKVVVIDDLNPPNFSPQNPRIQDGHDLNLAYNPSHYNAMSEFVQNHHNLSLMGFPDFKPSLGFEGFGNETNQSSRMLFPFEEMKSVSNNDQFEWNGMLGGGF